MREDLISRAVVKGEGGDKGEHLLGSLGNLEDLTGEDSNILLA